MVTTCIICGAKTRALEEDDLGTETICYNCEDVANGPALREAALRVLRCHDLGVCDDEAFEALRAALGAPKDS